METKKIVYVARTRRDRTTIWAGTIEELRTNVFGNILRYVNSWNKKISREPKSVASLVNNLNKSVDELQSGCYERDYYEVATKKQYDAQEAAKAEPAKAGKAPTKKEKLRRLIKKLILK